MKNTAFVIFLFLLPLLLLASCSNHRNADHTPAEIEELFSELEQKWINSASDSLINPIIDYLKKNKHPELLAEAYFLKGKIWRNSGRPSVAVDFFSRGINILEKEGTNPSLLSRLYGELGSIYLHNPLKEKSLEAYIKRAEIDKKIGSPHSLAISLHQIGDIYDQLGSSDSALYYFEEALKIAKQANDSIMLQSVIQQNIQDLYRKAKSYNRSMSRSFEMMKDPEVQRLLTKNPLQAVPADSITDDFRELFRYMRKNYFQDSTLFKFQEIQQIGKYSHDDIYLAISKKMDHSNRTIRLAEENLRLSLEKEKIELRIQRSRRILGSAFLIILLSSLLIFLLIIRKKKREMIEMENENNRIKLEQKLFFTEKEKSELNDQIARLTDDIANLKEKEVNDKEQTQKKIQEKEELLNLYRTESDARRFREKPIYERLIQIKENKQEKLGANEKKILEHDIFLSFPDYISEIKNSNPNISNEDIQILCLKKINFSSPTIGRIFNLSDSGVRTRISRAIPQRKD